MYSEDRVRVILYAKRNEKNDKIFFIFFFVVSAVIEANFTLNLTKNQILITCLIKLIVSNLANPFNP